MCAAVTISVTKDGIKFSASGDIGTANVTCRHNPTADKVSDAVLLKGGKGTPVTRPITTPMAALEAAAHAEECALVHANGCICHCTATTEPVQSRNHCDAMACMHLLMM